MDSVLRAAAIYLVVLVIIRMTGRRMLSEIDTFDFVLLLVIGEATQQALLGNDFSMINAVVVIVSLVAMDVLFSLIKRRWSGVTKFIEGEPMIVVEYGQLLQARVKLARITESDILEAARSNQGLERLDQIKFAVLEKNGRISIIPAQ